MIKLWVRGVFHAVSFIIGFMVYLLFNKTPVSSYRSMVSLFCLTKGYSNDQLSRAISFFDPPYEMSEARGILENMSDKTQLNSVVSKLRERGYFVFESLLSDELCDRLLHFANTNTCSIRPMDGQQREKSLITTYDRKEPQAVRYDFDTQVLLNNPDVQKIIADLSFIAIAQQYLKTKPILDVLSMWWHTAFSEKPDMEAAQYFHFDMDRPKWVKFFIYLTDVESTNGPHTFVAGSHKTGGISNALLKKGYARLTDEEIRMHYHDSDIIEFVAPRGTIIAEDSRGLHKGKHVEKGDRLILQVQFSNSLFGGDYPKANIGASKCYELEKNIKLYPKLYSAYL